MSKPSDEHETPPEIFNPLNEVFKFDLDAAASDSNHKCEKYFTEAHDSLEQTWGGYRAIWINPPYSNPLPWIRKAIGTCRWAQFHSAEIDIVMLLKCDPSTKVFELAYENGAGIYFITPRIKFVGSAQGANFPNMICHFTENSSGGVLNFSRWNWREDPKFWRRNMDSGILSQYKHLRCFNQSSRKLA